MGFGIFIEPFDVLFFRGGQPFSAAEDHFIESIFPPTPQTFQGILRSKILADQCGRFEEYRKSCRGCEKKGECQIPDEIGSPGDDYGKLTIVGPFLAKMDEEGITPHFSPPIDLLREEKEDTEDLFVHTPRPFEEFRSEDFLNDLGSVPFPFIKEPSGLKPLGKNFLSWTEMKQYLAGRLKTVKKLSYYIEYRSGIARDKNKMTTKRGYLYNAGFIRLEGGLGLFANIDGLSNPPSQLSPIGIGGEGKAGICHKVDKFNFELPKSIFEDISKSKKFKVVLTQPAFFQNGWRPSWINDDLTGEYQGIKLKLLSACVGKPVHIGGFDIARKIPKPMKKAVPAGSVYYFEILDGDIETIIKIFHNKNISNELSQIGFGHFFVGGV